MDAEEVMLTITDVLYSVNIYILLCVKHFQLSHVMDIVL